MVAEQNKKASYVGAPAYFALDLACHELWDAFDSLGLYLVGSALERPDWRDIDLRLIMTDEAFERLFPDASTAFQTDPRWLLLTVGISEHLSRVTGLPVDFQFQPQSHANEHFKGRRDAIGMRVKRERGG